jgi:hypothetical protein
MELSNPSSSIVLRRAQANKYFRIAHYKPVVEHQETAKLQNEEHT